MTVWIRVDGRPGIGLGHVARQVACAEAARDRSLDVRLVVPDWEPAHALLANHGFPTTASGVWWNEVQPGDLALFDGYELKHSEVAAADAAGAVTVWFEDRPIDGRQPDADLVVSPSLPDPIPPQSDRLLIGPRFSLVRREFREARRPRAPATDAILVTMGGTDPFGRSADVATEVVEAGRFDKVLLLAGPVTELGPLPSPIEVVRAPPSVAEVFDRVNAVVSAAGSTTWELLTMGVPSALLALVDNQVGVVRGALADGAAIAVAGAGDAAAVRDAVDRLADPQVQRELHRRSMAAVDGRGADRVLDAASAVAALR